LKEWGEQQEILNLVAWCCIAGICHFATMNAVTRGYGRARRCQNWKPRHRKRRIERLRYFVHVLCFFEGSLLYFLWGVIVMY